MEQSTQPQDAPPPSTPQQPIKKPKIIIDKLTVLGVGIVLIFLLALFTGLAPHKSQEVAVPYSHSLIY